MINNEANECYYFAVKNLWELYFWGWLRSKKEAIINGNNDFQIVLDDALNYWPRPTKNIKINCLY